MARYDIYKRVYYEYYDTVGDAFARERQRKKYLRHWNINLIKEDNPNGDEIKLEWDD